jgi:hypothetical protein
MAVRKYWNCQSSRFQRRWSKGNHSGRNEEFRVVSRHQCCRRI